MGLHTDMLPVADMLLTPLELSTLPRERLRPSQRLMLTMDTTTWAMDMDTTTTDTTPTPMLLPSSQDQSTPATPHMAAQSTPDMDHMDTTKSAMNKIFLPNYRSSIAI